MEKIKLVIWDLDDTFWKGTLSEGAVHASPENIAIVKELVDRGIMNTIVSKNDYDKARDILVQWGVWDLFIFPKISWNPKGEIVKQLLKQCRLRPCNTLFIDDNHSNIQEVKYYNVGIQTLNTKDLSPSILDDESLTGKDDETHSRLTQYKILERRTNEEVKYVSNIEFLKDSQIVCSIENDCMSELDRIAELVQRTNQLNYTKKRTKKEDLAVLFTEKTADCRVIRVKDRFGDYGVVGFYAIRNGCLEHFLFSCRILGLGVENYIYNKLQCPAITISGEVAAELGKTDVTWITESQIRGDTNTCKKTSILMIGGCDLQQTDFYLSSKYRIAKEFATVVEGIEIRTSDSTQLINTFSLPLSEKELLCEKLSFFNSGITFATNIFSGKYNVIIYSVVDDYIRAVYRHKTKNYCITFSSFFDTDTFQTDGRNSNDAIFINDNFTYEGAESVSFFDHNLRFILDHIFETNPNTIVLLINGNDIDVSDWVGQDLYKRNIVMNGVVDAVVRDYGNVHLVDMRKIVHGRDDFSKQDNRHYNRQVYYRMSMEIIQILKDMADLSGFKMNKNIIVTLRNFQKNIHDKISKTLFAKKRH